MSTRALEAIPRPTITEYRGDSGNSITAGSISSSTSGRVASPGGMSLSLHSLAQAELPAYYTHYIAPSVQSQRHASLNLSPVSRNTEQAPERSQASEDPKPSSQPAAHLWTVLLIFTISRGIEFWRE
jgi:hypothetical protein